MTEKVPFLLLFWMTDLFDFDVGEAAEPRDMTQFMNLRVMRSISPGPTFRKSKWTPEEDKLLIDSVNKHGMGNWSLVSQAVPGRTGKQCRERWINQLCPALNKDNWTPQEDAILIQQQRIHGNFWTKIAQFLPGRSSNNVKNRWSWLSRHRVPSTLAAQMIPMAQQNSSSPQQPQSAQPVVRSRPPMPMIHYPHQQTVPQPELNWGSFGSSIGENANNKSKMAFSDPYDTNFSAPTSYDTNTCMSPQSDILSLDDIFPNNVSNEIDNNAMYSDNNGFPDFDFASFDDAVKPFDW